MADQGNHNHINRIRNIPDHNFDPPPNPFLVEVERLHKFFVEWFTAKPNEVRLDDAIKQVMLDTQCGSHLAPDFSMVMPSGKVVDKAALLERLAIVAHGCHTSDGIFDIVIENFQVLHTYNQGTVALVMYDETQTTASPGSSTSSNGGGSKHSNETVVTTRRSTALMEKNIETDKIIWKHVHETWVEGKGPSSS